MNRSSTKRLIKFAPGTRLIGKWNKQSYTIVRLLGEGATGAVYLAQATGGLVAVKVGLDNMAITTEVNVLRQFSKQNNVTLGPELLDVDDVVFSQQSYPFYAMEYVHGQPFIAFIQGKGPEWLGLLMMQLLADLEKLHHEGWVFGDLKPDNLLITGPPNKVRWLDVGGTTLLGRSIKEYTEFYDRGYWNLGSRKAEPEYDLFSVAMIMINGAYPRRFDRKTGDTFMQLRAAIKGHALTTAFEPVLINALRGSYSSARVMKEELALCLQNQSKTHSISVKKKRQKKIKVKKKEAGYKLELFFSGCLIFIGCLIYLVIITT